MRLSYKLTKEALNSINTYMKHSYTYEIIKDGKRLKDYSNIKIERRCYTRICKDPSYVSESLECLGIYGIEGDRYRMMHTVTCTNRKGEKVERYITHEDFLKYISKEEK